MLEISGGSAARGQTTGRTLFIGEGVLSCFAGPVIPASFCRVVRFDTTLVEPRYAFYGLQDMYNSGRAGAYENQSTGISNFQFERFLDAELLRVPALVEQRRIVRLLKAIDDKIVANERIAKTSIELAQSIFDASKPETETTIDDVAAALDGPHATPRKVPEGPWFLSISSLKDGLLDLNESVFMAEEDFPRWTRRVQPQEGDVLFSYETRLGDAALMLPGIRASLGRRMAALRPKSPDTSGALLLHSYLSPAFHRQIKELAIHGATVDRIPLTDLPSWKLPLPEPERRAYYSKVLTGIHRRVAASLLEKRTLAALRDTLLPELMAGRLGVKDAGEAVEAVEETI
ncbi:restriction endonuclease subunit S [Micromonospora endolithica]|uniref:Restriction endonuclease subunit S n=1 Tax=Micromonospora endolithica TaxID=230091 RepID=A0A3A9ZCQ8_9ACTN|nr:restriction endonuclease subunit S [Micromonospora endolithica]